MNASDQTTGRAESACANCGAPLAPDQRYCLQCGTRRADVPPPYAREVPSAPPAAPEVPAAPQAPATPPAEPPRRGSEFSPLAAVLGIALLGGMLLIGVLIGREGSSDDPPPAQTIQVGEGQTTTSTPSATTTTPEAPAQGAVVSEWPAGTDGFTVQLRALPKADSTSADVDTAKSELEAQGAPPPSVLDSDLYPSLTPGEYVLYAGVYTNRAEAQSALELLQEMVTDASIVEVSASAAKGE